VRVVVVDDDVTVLPVLWSLYVEEEPGRRLTAPPYEEEEDEDVRNPQVTRQGK